MENYNLKLAVVKRFLRTYLPQVPAAVVYLSDLAGQIDAPNWVVPVLAFLGAVATALDKLLRETNAYERSVKFVLRR